MLKDMRKVFGVFIIFLFSIFLTNSISISESAVEKAAIPATPAEPGEPGEGATPATPAIPPVKEKKAKKILISGSLLIYDAGGVLFLTLAFDPNLPEQTITIPDDLPEGTYITAGDQGATIMEDGSLLPSFLPGQTIPGEIVNGDFQFDSSAYEPPSEAPAQPGAAGGSEDAGTIAPPGPTVPPTEVPSPS